MQVPASRKDKDKKKAVEPHSRIDPARKPQPKTTGAMHWKTLCKLTLQSCLRSLVFRPATTVDVAHALSAPLSNMWLLAALVSFGAEDDATTTSLAGSNTVPVGRSAATRAPEPVPRHLAAPPTQRSAPGACPPLT